MPRCGGIVRPQACRGLHLVTLCRFDSKPMAKVYLGPFIPCERRLALMEILEFKVVVLRPRF